MKKKNTKSKARHGPQKALNQPEKKRTPFQLECIKKINIVLDDSLLDATSEEDLTFLSRCRISVSKNEENVKPTVDKSTRKAPVMPYNVLPQGSPTLLKVIFVIFYAITDCCLHKIGLH